MSDQNLKNLVERIERLNEEKANIVADTKEAYEEAKAFGLCVKTIRAVIRARAKDPEELEKVIIIRAMDSHTREE